MCSDEQKTSRWEIPVGMGVGLFLLIVGVWLLVKADIVPGIACLFVALISFGEAWNKWRKLHRT